MDRLRKRLGDLITTLKQQRDELTLQAHLGRAEARRELQELTDRLQKLTDQFEPVKDAVGETAQGVWSSLELLAEEIQHGFVRLHDALHRGKDKPTQS